MNYPKVVQTADRICGTLLMVNCLSPHRMSNFHFRHWMNVMIHCYVSWIICIWLVLICSTFCSLKLWIMHISPSNCRLLVGKTNAQQLPGNQDLNCFQSILHLPDMFTEITSFQHNYCMLLSPFRMPWVTFSSEALSRDIKALSEMIWIIQPLLFSTEEHRM